MYLSTYSQIKMEEIKYPWGQRKYRDMLHCFETLYPEFAKDVKEDRCANNIDSYRLYVFTHEFLNSKEGELTRQEFQKDGEEFIINQMKYSKENPKEYRDLCEQLDVIKKDELYKDTVNRLHQVVDYATKLTGCIQSIRDLQDIVDLNDDLIELIEKFKKLTE